MKPTKKEILSSIDKMGFREKLLFINNTRKLYNCLCKTCKAKVILKPNISFEEYCDKCQDIAKKYLSKWIK